MYVGFKKGLDSFPPKGRYQLSDCKYTHLFVTPHHFLPKSFADNANITNFAQETR